MMRLRKIANTHVLSEDRPANEAEWRRAASIES